MTYISIINMLDFPSSSFILNIFTWKSSTAMKFREAQKGKRRLDRGKGGGEPQKERMEKKDRKEPIRNVYNAYQRIHK